MSDLVLQLNKDGTLLEFSGRLEDNYLFILSDESLDKKIFDIMPSDIAGQIMSCLEKALQNGDPQHFEYQSLVSDDHYELRLIAIGKDKALAIISNISGYKQAVEKIEYLAYHDTLTNLPNRYMFNDRLEQAIAYAERKKQLLAILFLDIDNFKHINDTIGHKAGDRLLQGIADRLTIGIRKTDTITRLSTGPSDYSKHVVARLGGDEFTVLLTDIRNIQDPARVAQRILNMLSEPLIIGDQEVFVTASVGIAVYPLDGKDIHTLLINADVAMYQAKKNGGNNFQYYSESMNKSAFERFTIENKLRKALDRNEFIMFYQPQIDISTGRMIGVEALIRWMQPDLILVRPGEFIPIAEQSGLIIPMGEWVLRTVCAENRAWQKAGLKPIRTTVNVSSVQFRQKNFVERVSQILSDTSFDPKYLQLELTESVVMEDSQNAIKKLHSLQAMGIQIAIDDFGTGYSSMNYLKRLPLSTLKIDYSFIKDLATSSVDQTIVKAIVALAHNFNLTVIAEGVEKREQLAFLRDCGCEGVQGFLICPPVNSEILREFIKNEKFLAVLNNYGIMVQQTKPKKLDIED
jgi:predicted signal transduction protein with EAL and GGDEF domain